MDWDSVFISTENTHITMVVDKELADYILEHYPSKYDRSSSRAFRKEFADHCRAGTFYGEDTDAITIDKNGNRKNGKTRLQGISDSGIAQTVWFHIGVNPDTPLEAYTRARASQGSQYLPGPHSKIKAGACAFLAVTKGNSVNCKSILGSVQAKGVKDQDTRTVYEKWADELESYADPAKKASKVAKIAPGAHLAILSMANRTKYSEKIPEWLAGVTDGINLQVDDPRLRLRQKTIDEPDKFNNANKLHVTFCLIGKAWNLFALGRKCKQLSYKETENPIGVIDFNYSQRDVTGGY